MDEVDFLVIGSGSGLDVANAAVNQGQSVAVVEKGRLGGTCLNRGCNPSKMLLYHAEGLETLEPAGEVHIDATVDAVGVSAMLRAGTQEFAQSDEDVLALTVIARGAPLGTPG